MNTAKAFQKWVTRGMAILGLTVTAPVFADTELKTVQLGASPLRLVLAGEPGDSAETILKSYVQSLEESLNLRPHVGHLKAQPADQISARPLGSKSGLRVLLLANDVSDYTLSVGKAHRFHELLEAAGAEVHVLPVAFLKSVPEADRETVKKELMKNFDSVVALGGDDVAPKFYGRYNTHSENVNYDRDVWEAQILMEAVKDPSVYVLGICRGHQLIAASLGLNLYQDISSFLKTSIDHGSEDHPLQLMHSKSGDLLRLLPELRQGFLVNSRHHQSVVPALSTKLEPVAMSPDGVVEAMEFKNGRGLTVQFHPEYFAEEVAHKFFQRFVQMVAEKSSKSTGNSCESLLKAS